MPTLELLSPSIHPDGWRQVRAPGGYESWHFAATSALGRTYVAVSLNLGQPLDRAYARRYWLYRRFPTRVAPPLPSAYPSVSLTVMQDERVLWRMIHSERGAEMTLRPDAGNVRMGSSHIETMSATAEASQQAAQEVADLTTPRTPAGPAIRVRARGELKGRIATVDMVFKPRAMAACGEIVNGPHRVAVVAPVCDVDGEIELFDPGTRFPQTIRMTGLGFHEHRFGTRWQDEPATSGASLLDGRAVLMHAMGSRVHVMDVSVDRCRQVWLDGIDMRRSGAMVCGEEIEIANPRAISSASVVFDASIGALRSEMTCETIASPSPIKSLLGFLHR